MVSVISQQRMVPVVPPFKQVLCSSPTKKNTKEYWAKIACIETTLDADSSVQTEIELMLHEGIPFLVGRQSPECPFNSALLSRRHAELLILDDTVVLASNSV
ncbi:hypothetical protein DI09_42p240 [Mitosporidium daphniae]|uniref:FHA domain-containing protein n=1 Tax=Mitosporidium daphniae TaxID=1485682 RepID=A0A098VTX9_9MICR|nr:uncharacterized protein DI09_42p240 [Mitosporidium daphniae]KGG51181.1 hypothetical protein DI09_42p240 [Mitosporidium daphniae]|eukprot:XP_013237608.1 uncharacterized protein DI09_42p240 [Mitosporidium daphniae]